MSNMSYCRFQNTSKALDDCQAALEDIINGDARALSDEELEAAKELVATAYNIIELLAEQKGVDMDELVQQIDAEQTLMAALDDINDAAEEFEE